MGLYSRQKKIPIYKKHLSSYKFACQRKEIRRKCIHTASLHSLADALYTVQIGQLVIGQESLCDSRVKAPCHSAALSWFILESHFHSMHSHGRSGAATAEVGIELPHGLLDELLSVTVHLQGQITWLQVPQLFHLTPKLGLLHLKTTQFSQDLQCSEQSRCL